MISLDDYPETKRVIEEQLNKGKRVEVKLESCGTVLSVVVVDRKVYHKETTK